MRKTSTHAQSNKRSELSSRLDISENNYKSSFLSYYDRGWNHALWPFCEYIYAFMHLTFTLSLQLFNPRLRWHPKYLNPNPGHRPRDSSTPSLSSSPVYVSSSPAYLSSSPAFLSSSPASLSSSPASLSSSVTECNSLNFILSMYLSVLNARFKVYVTRLTWFNLSNFEIVALTE